MRQAPRLLEQAQTTAQASEAPPGTRDSYQKTCWTPTPLPHRVERPTAAQPWHPTTMCRKKLIFSFYVAFLIRIDGLNTARVAVRGSDVFGMWRLLVRLRRREIVSSTRARRSTTPRRNSIGLLEFEMPLHSRFLCAEPRWTTADGARSSPELVEGTPISGLGDSIPQARVPSPMQTCVTDLL